jgi:hypothetical protein
MIAARAGCYYCFTALDPQDKRDGLRTFVQCRQCGTPYHEQCWAAAEYCLRCEGDEAQAKNSISPEPIRAVTKRHAVPITPSAVVYVGTEEQSSTIPTWRQYAQYLEQSLRSAIIALLLTGIAVLLGVFVYRITKLEVITPETVMNVIFKREVPTRLTIIGACIAGLIAALVFYPKYSGTESSPFLTRFAAGLIGCVLLDAILVNIAVTYSREINASLYLEAIWAQGSTSLITFAFTPIYRWKSLAATPPGRLPAALVKLYGWCRLLVVSGTIIVIAAYLSTSDEMIRLLTVYLPRDILPLQLPGIRSINNSPIRLPFDLSFPMAGALLCGLAVAYWVPKHRHPQGNFVLFRVLLAVACVLFIGLLYRALPSPSGYLNAVIVTFLIVLIATPLQYTLS